MSIFEPIQWADPAVQQPGEYPVPAKFLTLLILVFVSFHMASSASADVMSEAAKIGANAGAMNYCKDKIASDDDKKKYGLLSTKAMKEYRELDGSDKARALVSRKAAEDGDYLGDPLTEKRCDSLRKILLIRYK